MARGSGNRMEVRTIVFLDSRYEVGTCDTAGTSEGGFLQNRMTTVNADTGMDKWERRETGLGRTRVLGEGKVRSSSLDLGWIQAVREATFEKIRIRGTELEVR